MRDGKTRTRSAVLKENWEREHDKWHWENILFCETWHAILQGSPLGSHVSFIWTSWNISTCSTSTWTTYPSWGIWTTWLLSWPAWLWWWLTSSDGLLQHFLLGSSRQLKILRGVLAFQCKLLFIIINTNITIITTIAMVIVIDFDDRRKSWVDRNGPCWPTSPRRARTNIGIQRWMISWFVSKTFIKNVWPLGITKLHYTITSTWCLLVTDSHILRFEMPDNFAIMIMIINIMIMIMIIIIMIRLWPGCLRWWCLFAWLALEISSLFFRLFSTGYNADLHRFTAVENKSLKKSRMLMIAMMMMIARNMRTTINFYLVNLSVADLLITAWCPAHRSTLAPTQLLKYLTWGSTPLLSPILLEDSSMRKHTLSLLLISFLLNS